MSDQSRIEELRRRVQRDPASIAFAQLAEEHRRAGQLEEAVDVARTGLLQHPAYLSARVTLGRALLELGQLDEAAAEFEFVVQAAPDNLTAVRQLAEIHQKRRHITNETKSRMPPSVTTSPTGVTPPDPASPASATAMEAGPAKQEADAAKQQADPAKQQSGTAKQPEDRGKRSADAPKQDVAPQFVVELTSQTAHIIASPSASSAPTRSPVSAPPVATSLPAAAERIPQDIAQPQAAAPLDPVIAELEAWLAVLEDERAARAAAPQAGR